VNLGSLDIIFNFDSKLWNVSSEFLKDSLAAKKENLDSFFLAGFSYNSIRGLFFRKSEVIFPLAFINSAPIKSNLFIY
jgi:hypothetical protein